MLDRPSVPADSLGDMFASVNAHALVSAVFSAGGRWSLRFPPVPSGVKFGVLLAGSCFLAVDGCEPIRLQTGECYLLAPGRPYVLASDLHIAPVSYDGSLSGGCGDEVRIAGGRFAFDGPGAALLDELPPVMHADAATDVAGVLPWVLERLRSELIGNAAGSAHIVQQLAHVMFVYLVRAYLSRRPGDGGWLRILGDARVGDAVRRIHAEPARRWTVGELADGAGLSRSSFASHFRRAAGIAPLAYVVRWRVRVAEQSLIANDTTVAALAATLGYESESAFSNAFKRVTGCAPARYRAARRSTVRRVL